MYLSVITYPRTIVFALQWRGLGLSCKPEAEVKWVTWDISNLRNELPSSWRYFIVVV
jgi:hypothetical protein